MEESSCWVGVEGEMYISCSIFQEFWVWDSGVPFEKRDMRHGKTKGESSKPIPILLG